MIEIFGISTNKSSSDTFQIQWNARRSPTTSTDSVSNYNFYVMHSDDPVNGFVDCVNIHGIVIVIDGAVGPLYAETSFKDINRNRERYFKVRAVNKTNPATIYYSSVSSNNDRSDGIIKTIEHAESLLNSLYIGEESYILKRKVDGERCPECWNPYSFRRTKTTCATCHSTGFYDGFYAAIETSVAFDRNPKVAEQSQTGEIQATNIRGRLGSFPLVTPRDLIVIKSSNDRFTIVSIDYTKLPNIACGRGNKSNDSYVISQMLNMAQLYPSDPLFDVVLNGKDIRGTGTLTAPSVEVVNG